VSLVTETASKGFSWDKGNKVGKSLKAEKQYLKLVRKIFSVAALKLCYVKYSIEFRYKMCVALTVIHLAKSTHSSLSYLLPLT
jgi:hypothetical protein